MEVEGTEDVTVDSKELSDVEISSSVDVDEYSGVDVSEESSVIVDSDDDTLYCVDSEYVIVDGTVEVKSADVSVENSTVEDIVTGLFEDVSVLETV